MLINHPMGSQKRLHSFQSLFDRYGTEMLYDVPRRIGLVLRSFHYEITMCSLTYPGTQSGSLWIINPRPSTITYKRCTKLNYVSKAFPTLVNLNKYLRSVLRLEPSSLQNLTMFFLLSNLIPKYRGRAQRWCKRQLVLYEANRNRTEDSSIIG